MILENFYSAPAPAHTVDMDSSDTQLDITESNLPNLRSNFYVLMADFKKYSNVDTLDIPRLKNTNTEIKKICERVELPTNFALCLERTRNAPVNRIKQSSKENKFNRQFITPLKSEAERI